MLEFCYLEFLQVAYSIVAEYPKIFLSGTGTFLVNSWGTFFERPGNFLGLKANLKSKPAEKKHNP